MANLSYVSMKFPLADFPRDPPASQYEGDIGIWSAIKDDVIGPEKAREIVVPSYERTVARCARWIAHLDNRLAYERAMLGESGGTVADKTRPEKGGACKCWASPRGGWSHVQKVNKVSVTVMDNWGNGGGNFTRTIPFDKLSGVMSAAEVCVARQEGRVVETDDGVGFYLKEPKREESDARDGEAVRGAADVGGGGPGEDRAGGDGGVPADRQSGSGGGEAGLRHADHPEPGAGQDAAFDAMRASLKAGVKVVSAPSLFPTPPDVARRLVEMAGIDAGDRVLEPSAGTGNLIEAIRRMRPGEITACEHSISLADALRAKYGNKPWMDAILAADFLDLTAADIGTFDKIVMNPPFDDAADIKHVKHALGLLRPGGRLVAIMASGPRQLRFLENAASTFFGRCVSWEPLPAGTFAGTAVNSMIVVMEAFAENEDIPPVVTR